MAKTRQPAPAAARPMPPADLGSSIDGPRIVPATGLREWLVKTFIEEDGKLHNPDHKHLLWARFECLWAADSFTKQGRTVVGLCEELAFRVSGWPRWRQEQQLQEWFGAELPDYLLTFDATYCRQASEAEFCALVEHELYHVGHKRDEFGEPAFTEEGMPKLFLRGHDVEEFIGVVRRYGAGRPDGAVAQLVNAANAKPTVSRLQLQHACGTCLLRAA